MTRSKWLLLDGRAFEIRDRRVMTSFEIWVYENDRPLGLHGTLTLRDAAAGLAAGQDILGQAMQKAIDDLQAGCFKPMPLRASA
jgi:hypothetical protein